MASNTHPVQPSDQSPTFSLIKDVCDGDRWLFKKKTTGRILGEDGDRYLVHFFSHEENRPHSFWTQLIG
jgi:hypothetical protein